MTRVHPGTVKTFSIGFEEQHHDEAPFARRVAEHLGTDHHEHYMAPRDLLSAIPAMVECYDEPFADPSALPTYFLSRFARSEVTVALSGDGGDELMGGYARYARAGLVGTTARVLPAIARRALFGAVRRLPTLTPDAVATGIPDDPLRMFHYLVARFKGEDHERLIGRRYDFSHTRFERAFHATSDRALLARLLLVDFVTYLPDQMFTKVDRASMAHALEVRVPLMDNDLVAYAFGLPVSSKIRGRQTKVLLKRLLERYVPPELFRRPKRGFSPPIDEWLRGDLRHLVERYLAPERIRARGLLDADFLEAVVARHRTGHRGFQHMLWTVIVLEMWFERWID
jgi:asparagine synthase (glutamine-hydrolysing)